MMSHAAEKYDLLFGRSVTPAALAIYRKLGFRYLAHCKRWIAVLDPAAALDLAVDPTELTAKRAHARRVNVDQTIPYSVDRRVPLGAEALAARVLTDAVTFRRTQVYLSWRYENHPYLPYQFISIGNPGWPDGVAVVRVERVLERNGRVLRILEFIADLTNGVKLGCATLAFAFAQNCAYVDMFGVSERFVSGFVSAGGFDVDVEPDLRLPHLLRPWDAHFDTSDLIFWAKKNLFNRVGLGALDDMSLVHISKGDSNLDWPSWVPAGDGHDVAPKTQLQEHL